MDYRLEPVSFEDGDQIIDIFNYYVENSFAAYPESKVPHELFQYFLNLTQGYPFLVAKDMGGKVVGFGSLRPYSPLTTFSRAAEITNFISLFVLDACDLIKPDRIKGMFLGYLLNYIKTKI